MGRYSARQGGLGGGTGQKAMAIGVLAFKGEVERARGECTGIDAPLLDRKLRHRGAATGDGDNLGERELHRGASPYPSAASARFASVPSLKSIVRSCKT